METDKYGIPTATKKLIVKTSIACLLILTMTTHACKNSEELLQKPNIVFFLIDDLGWKDLACYGSAFYETPSIDRLAAEGVRFTQAYSAFSLCTPSRLAIMTGKNPARLSMPGTLGGLPDAETTFAEVFQEHGYKTFYAGKWHLGKKGHDQYLLPEEQGFDVNIGGHEAGQPGSYFYPYKGRGKVKMPNGSTFDFQVPHLENGKDGEYKLIDWYENGNVELFNLRDDQSERYDLSDELPEKTKEMISKLNSWRNKCRSS